ncbi:MAG: NAD(P)-binding domain-containing protein [Alphaproteobacteria bacterium]|nr:NAD(P)-binding domain-containing protein [Alphaproteobacteria bacterium]MCB9929321.1 NAD(P)-binding domain-containing protein [Alphaproteobacteria bacterium]
MTNVQSVFQRDLQGPVAGPNRRGAKRVAVIGAGACGLAAAKYLLEADFDVTVFEIGSQIGGMWCYKNDNGRSSAYRTLHINTSRGVTRFSDLDFDDRTQPFPDHFDMHRYLVQYADHFGVTPRIRFNSKVERVRPLFTPGQEAPRWRVDLADGSGQEFDAVIVATGHLTRPMEVPEFQAFTGEYLHSHHYKEPEPFVGKRVCVVGIGNSACDIASDVCVTSPRTVLVARSGVVILPKLMFGRAFTDITAQIQRPWIPRKLRQKITRFLVWLVHGDMTRLGFQKPTANTHVTSNATVVTDIAYRRIAVKPGITRVDGRTLQFADGTAEEFDTLIAATGYAIDLDFLPPEVVTLENNELDLYMRIVPPDWPGLFLMGFFNTDTALNMVFEHQARWVREVLLENAALPPAAEMKRAIAERKAWYASQYKHTARHTIEEEHVRYLGDLKRTLKAMVKRAAGALGKSRAA